MYKTYSFFPTSRKFGEDKIHATTTYPGYQDLYQNLESDQKCNLSQWKPKYTSKGWVFGIDDLISLIEEKTRLLMINFPHNPTGYIPHAHELHKIIDYL